MSVCVLIASQRSGTGALGSVFNQIPELSYVAEIFYKGHIGHYSCYFTFYLEKIRQDPMRALPGHNMQNFKEYLEYLADFHPGKTVIIDVKYNSTHLLNDFVQQPLGTPAFIRYCYQNNLPVIHLRRDNLLKMVISTLIARKNGVAHTHDLKAIHTPTVRIDPAFLLASLNEAVEQRGFMDKLLPRVERRVDLSYETLFATDGTIAPAARQSMASLLNLKDFPDLKPAFVKQTRDDLRQVIENYDEILACLSETPFAWMLEN